MARLVALSKRGFFVSLLLIVFVAIAAFISGSLANPFNRFRVPPRAAFLSVDADCRGVLPSEWTPDQGSLPAFTERQVSDIEVVWRSAWPKGYFHKEWIIIGFAWPGNSWFFLQDQSQIGNCCTLGGTARSDDQFFRWHEESISTGGTLAQGAQAQANLREGKWNIKFLSTRDQRGEGSKFSIALFDVDGSARETETHGRCADSVSA